MFLNLEKHPQDKIALIDDSKKTVTYGELINYINQVEMPIKETDLVFHLVSNTIDSAQNYLYFVEHQFKSLILSKSIAPDLLSKLVEVYHPNYIVADSDVDIAFSVIGTVSAGNQTAYKLFDEQHELYKNIELLMSTSGSTGSPKLVKYKRGNLQENAENVAVSFEWTSTEVSLCSLPLNYTMGLNVLNSQMVVGATAVLTNHNVISREHWNLIDEYSVSNYTGVPFSFEVMKKFRFLNQQFPSLKTICQGGGKLSSQLFSDLANYCKGHGKRFIASFGTTETSARMMMLPPQYATEKLLSIGLPIANGRAYLLDESGQEIKEERMNGELVYSGPNVTLGYAVQLEDLKNGDEFKGVYRTGDIAYRDADGFYYIVGRLKRFLKINANRISLDDIENIVKEKFDISVAASGQDDHLVIYIETDNIDEIRKYVSQTIHVSHLQIKVIKIDKIPRSDSGKIQYSQLT